MKKTILLSVLIFTLILPLSGGVSAPNVVVTFLSQTPDPVQPGDYVDVRWKVENYGSATLEDLTFTIIPTYPFSLNDVNEKNLKIDSLNARLIGQDSLVVRWRLRVDPEAVEGNNTIQMMYTIGDKQVIEVEPNNINIKTTGVLLTVDSIKMKPNRLKSGESSTVNITVKNIADSLISNARVTLDFEDTGLSAIDSTNQKVIERLRPGKEGVIQFNLIADADASTGVHKVPLDIKYFDREGDEKELSTTISIIVDNPPDYLVNLEEKSVYTKKQKGSVVISVSNIGVSDIQFVTLDLLPSKAFTSLSTSSVYLGNLESDDFETAEFEIYVTSDDQAIELPLKLTFKDSYNKPYTNSINVPLQLFSSSDAKKYGFVEKSSSGPIFLILVILGAAGFYYYKKRRKKR